jgi:uncharacterized protein YdhG (YjbR/CyaY superfamily)
MAAASTVEEYIAGFPPEVRVLLLRLRETIRQAVPNGVETMSYDMPTVMVDGERAIYWTASKKHLAMYATNGLPPAIEREAESYRTEKDTLQFAYRKEVPFDLIADIAKHLAARPH